MLKLRPSRQALEKCFADHSVNAILIDPPESTKKVHRFYERLGFKFLGRHRLDGENTNVERPSQEMIRVIREWEQSG